MYILTLPEMVGFFIDLNAPISSDRHLTVACKSKKGIQPNRLNPFDTAGARDENRTRTPIRARDFKSLASTSSATQAPCSISLFTARSVWLNPPFEAICQILSKSIIL